MNVTPTDGREGTPTDDNEGTASALCNPPITPEAILSSRFCTLLSTDGEDNPTDGAEGALTVKDGRLAIKADAIPPSGFCTLLKLDGGGAPTDAIDGVTFGND